MPSSDTSHSVNLIETPPSSTIGILRRLGPGLIIAGSIVGSGELIATTKTGADAGFTLLWLICLGCVIKVFVQVEFGRFTVCRGLSSLEGMDLVPGPRAKVNWLVWYWLLMFLAGIGQLGGIVGGVGQSLAMTVPIQGDYLKQLNDQDTHAKKISDTIEQRLHTQGIDKSHVSQVDQIKQEVVREVGPFVEKFTWDDIIWSTLITAVTSVLLVNGRYGLIQAVSTILVAGFTLLTICNLFALPFFSEYKVTWENLREGLSFGLPQKTATGGSSLGTALASFGIIGVGASELVAYPYWCLEKGYARFTGPREDTSDWAERANGWLRVMRWDAWCSMLIYTLATVAFYLLGASVLHSQGLSPSGNQMIRTLAAMYADVFRPWGNIVFLFGAFAVLYSTFFVATAGNARIASDALSVFGLRKKDEASRLYWVKLFCGMFPVMSLIIFVLVKQPVFLVLFSGALQAFMLPMLGGAGLYFRYFRCDSRVTPGKLWDGFLWLSVGGLLITGCWGLWEQMLKIPGLFK